MDEIYKEIEDKLTPDDVEEICLATVSEVSASGLKLTIDGEDEASDKLYKCNSSVVFHVGDRVKFSRVSGSLLVDYVIGYPSSDPADTHGIPSGGSKGQVLAKSSATDYDVAWVTQSGLPSGGSAGQTLTKKSGSDYDVQWSTLSVGLLKNGSYTVTLNTQGALVPNSSGSVSIGTTSIPFGNLYTNGYVQLGANAYNARLGFFGTSPITKITSITTSSTLANLIQALKNYGLL